MKSFKYSNRCVRNSGDKRCGAVSRNLSGRDISIKWIRTGYMVLGEEFWFDGCRFEMK